MGSFNQTCAISHLPIKDGDEVVCFLLAKAYGWTDHFEGYTGPGNLWQAISLPFYGKYDDYGSVKIDDCRLADITAGAFWATGTKGILEAGKERKNPEINMGHPFGTSRLHLMMVHGGLWEKLSASCVSPYGRRIGLEFESGRIDEFLDVAIKLFADKFARMEEFSEFWTKETGQPWTETPYVAEFFSSGRSGGVHPVMRVHLKRAVENLMEHGRRPEARDILSTCLRMAIFDENFGKLRRTWIPQSGLGAQDEDYDLHLAVADWSAARCRQIAADDEIEFGAGDAVKP